METILVVDDEEKWLQVVSSYLEKEGYRVLQTLNGTDALAILEKHPGIDVVLLDWMMPRMSGLDVLRQIRKFSDVPILFLTAKSDEVDKLLGLELGADDYLTKPFSMREMVARIRVILRRVQKVTQHGREEKEENTYLKRGPLTIDKEGYKVWVRDQEVSLTPTEFKLLVTLASKPGRTYSRLQLLEIVLGEAYVGYERSIDTHVHNLRKKLAVDPDIPSLIQTVFGIGYKLEEQ